jgi:cytochrome c biogenesis protein CcmG/thiol:disulfide interchange protein DsbE
MRKVLLIVVALAIVFTVYKVNRHDSGPTKPGQPAAAHSMAPDFSLQELNGQSLNLSDYRGKIVLLDFWATWCGPCRDEIPHFVQLQDEYRQQGLQVVGISMDDGPKPVRDFYQQFKMNYPVALGNEKVAEAYGGVLGLPVAFLIGRDGRIHAKYKGEVNMSVLEQEIKTLLQAN